MLPTRRDVAALLTGTGLFFCTRQFVFGASPFWNKKDKNEWSSDEIHSLTTKSPWAKEVRIEYRKGLQPNFDGTPGGLAMPANEVANGTPVNQQAGARMNVPLSGSGADAGSSGTNARRGGDPAIPIEATAATVRWESAPPILDALKTSVPDDFEGRYVISVTGLPLQADRWAVPAAILKSSSYLQAKGKEPAQPGVVRYTKDGSRILFGFAKEFFPLSIADKDIQFLVNSGDIEIRARFDPKEMIYHGQLAI
jgi:hypothetical protein